MVSDGQVKELWRLLAQGKSLATSSRMTGMSEKTARKYQSDQPLPSERKQPRNYRTRTDRFIEVWPEIEQQLEQEPRLKAYALFGWLQASRPGEFPDSTRRTFERRVAQWQALHGPPKPVFFSQVHQPGQLAASDFTVCNELDVTIAGQKFEHSFYHCVLTYSNVESVSLCFSESFEALSEGIQKAFWEFGGVPQQHRTDSLSAAVKNHSSRKLHTTRYTALMDHYACQPQRTNARCANENGDVESANGHFKDRLDQALLLRGSREFDSRREYVTFVEQRVVTANSHRQERLAEEQSVLQRLPDQRLDTADILLDIRVSKGSTIRVRTNVYSVPSRLIGLRVDVRIEAEQIDVTYQGHPIQTVPRLVGKQCVSINFRHVIDSLVRKPGAFASYRYQQEMFPTSQFRIAYDMLDQAHSRKVADKAYVKILELAARESLAGVDHALRLLIKAGVSIDFEVIQEMVQDAAKLPPVTEVKVEAPDLNELDSLFTTFDKESLSDEQVETPISQCGSPEWGGPETETEQDTSNPLDAFESIVKPIATERLCGVDRTVSGVADAELSGSLCRVGDGGGDRRLEPFGLSVGADDVGVRDATSGTDQACVDAFEVAAGQDVAGFRFQPPAPFGDPANGIAQGGFVFGSAGERVVVRETGFGKEPCIVCVGRAVDPAWAPNAVHHMRNAGSAIVDCQAGLAVAETVQATVKFRGVDHRRSGLRAAESRGDGGLVHAVGRALRTGQRAIDQQPSVQQVEPDIQGHHDDRSSDRPSGSPQRDHRDERAKLPHRNGKKGQSKSYFKSVFQRCQQKIINFATGNSNCR